MSDKEKLTVTSFAKMKQEGTKIVMVTAYDYSMGRAVSQTDVDIILVGDSLGMVVLGYETTVQVTMADMISHTAATRRGAPDTFIIGDMPFMSYHDVISAKLNAASLIVEGGANAVKLEGGSPSRIEAVKAIVDCEIPVCGHIGLTPQ
ncbi:MAG: 3-methyl-2-oxobutanoate hydroxymethyltransferase, partial [Candidatus Cloacimonetes bacterium]|nr:3-methyl-2-oxobutanoate hydroxymethyltransferase [Candidatus Cloacimonadota bacterium]